MTKWKHRWVCPHWEFLWYQEDAPDIPFAERNRESGATFLDILNVQGHNVSVRVDFYDLQGNADGRFGLEGIVGNKSVWAYRTDTGPNFPKPAPGQTVTAQGWFEVRSTEPVQLAAYVMGEKYTAHSRAWAFSLPLYEWPYTLYQALPSGSKSASEGFFASAGDLPVKRGSRKKRRAAPQRRRPKKKEP